MKYKLAASHPPVAGAEARARSRRCHRLAATSRSAEDRCSAWGTAGWTFTRRVLSAGWRPSAAPRSRCAPTATAAPGRHGDQRELRLCGREDAHRRDLNGDPRPAAERSLQRGGRLAQPVPGAERVGSLAHKHDVTHHAGVYSVTRTINDQDHHGDGPGPDDLAVGKGGHTHLTLRICRSRCITVDACPGLDLWLPPAQSRSSAQGAQIGPGTRASRRGR